MIEAMTHTQGTLLTVLIIVVLAILFGVIVISSDTDWFD